VQSTRHFQQIIFRDNGVGYIIGENGCLMKSVDSGEHWTDIENSPEINWNGIFLTGNGGYLCGAGGRIYRFAG
jgi:photosystem II stability/assembly factor-like uncharacterized protein